MHAGDKTMYELGPLPFGTQRDGVTSVACATVAAGCSCRRWGGSCVAGPSPPVQVIHTKGGEVLISLAQAKPVSVAPKKVQEDPLVRNDPWLQSRMQHKQATSSAPAPPPVQFAASVLEKMEQRTLEKFSESDQSLR